jgi:4-hydroxybenzoate polyprenyltransferase
MNQRGYRALALCGTEYARGVLRGERPILDVPVHFFVTEIALALRPHFFALSSLAALAGAASANPNSRVSVRLVLAAVISGLGWGVGQLINDLMDQESDAMNAPDRAIAAGRLPAGPTLMFAAVLGLALAAGTVFVHPRAWIFVPVAALLLIFYNGAKRRPLLGNVAHAMLMAAAAAIGISSVMPLEENKPVDIVSFLRAVWVERPMLAMVGAIAAWYLQSNYEKDRRGDRAAGYITLAAVLSVRASAVLRGVGILAIGVLALAAGLLPEAVSKSTMVAAVLLGVASAVGPALRCTDQASLEAYRIAVPASILAMLALSAPLLGRWGTTIALVAALVLVRAAFQRSSNP